MILRSLAVLTAMCSGAAVATPVFQSGHLFWMSRTTPVALYDVTPGPWSFTQIARVTEEPGKLQFGQIVFSPDRRYAYATVSQKNAVYQIDPAGNATPFATGLTNATGIAFDGDRLLAGVLGNKVYDITAGGPITAATKPYAEGFSGALRNMIATDNKVFVADSVNGTVKVLKPGRTQDIVFASGLVGVVDFAVVGSRLYAVTQHDNRTSAVFDITNGGNFSNAAAFAWGVNMAAITSLGDQLFASSNYREPTAMIWEITNGGPITNCSAVLTIPTWGDTMFEAIQKMPGSAGPAVGTPEPATLCLVGAALVGGAALARRHKQARGA